MTGPDSKRPAIIEHPAHRRETGRPVPLALALALGIGLSGCQTDRPGVYLDPQANLGTPPIAAKVGSPPPSTDAQGQANDEFDTQSWVDRRRPMDDIAPSRARRAETRPTQGEEIPLLHPPSPDGPDLNPSMFRRAARP